MGMGAGVGVSAGGMEHVAVMVEGDTATGKVNSSACLLQAARWVDGALSSRQQGGVTGTQTIGTRRKADELLTRHMHNTSSQLLLRWRRPDEEVEGGEDEDDNQDRFVATSFVEVRRRSSSILPHHLCSTSILFFSRAGAAAGSWLKNQSTPSPPLKGFPVFFFGFYVAPYE